MKKDSSPSTSSSSAAQTIPAAIERDRSGQNDNNYTSHEAISRRAYELWQEAGGPTGRETEFWLEAEQELGDVATANNQSKKN